MISPTSPSQVITVWVPHAGNALEVRPQLAAGSRLTLADPPGQTIRPFCRHNFSIVLIS